MFSGFASLVRTSHQLQLCSGFILEMLVPVCFATNYRRLQSMIRSTIIFYWFERAMIRKLCCRLGCRCCRSYAGGGIENGERFEVGELLVLIPFDSGRMSSSVLWQLLRVEYKKRIFFYAFADDNVLFKFAISKITTMLLLQGKGIGKMAIRRHFLGEFVQVRGRYLILQALSDVSLQQSQRFSLFLQNEHEKNVQRFMVNLLRRPMHLLVWAS